MAISLWRRLAQQLFSSSPAQNRRRRKQRADFYRPRFEALEERALLAVRIWDGGSPLNSDWTTASNWVGNVAPVANDELVFPEAGVGPLDRLTHNNFRTGTSFHKVTIAGNNYTLSGNPITIGEGGLLLLPDRSLAAAVTGTIQFDITLTGRSTVADVQLGSVLSSTLVLEGSLSGSTILVKSGEGDLTYKGNTPNTNRRETRVQQGRLLLQKGPGVTAIAGPLVVGDGHGADRVMLQKPNQISDTAGVTINSSGVLELSLHPDTIGPLTLSGGTVTGLGAPFGDLQLNGPVTTIPAGGQSTISLFQMDLGSTSRIFNVGDSPAAEDLVISTHIVGANSGLTKLGPGTLVLEEANSYGQATILQEGTLLVNGVLTNSPTIVNGGELGGRGTLGNVTMNGGSISPSGTIFPIQPVLTVNTLRTVTTAGSSLPSTFVFETNNVLESDLLKVTGVDSLGVSLDLSPNPFLDLRLGAGFAPAVGSQLKIIDIGAGLPAATGVFRDALGGNLLNEGSPLTRNDQTFTISYEGGDGNDVVLTRNNPPAFQNRSVTPVIPEGGIATLTGTITEPNAGDTFFLDVNWGDGSPKETFTFPPGSPPNVSVTHKYLDDNPSVTPRDRYTIHLLWRDQHGGSNTGTLPIVVRNVAPSLSNLTFSSPVVQGQRATLSGLINDPGLRDTFRLLVIWGDGSRPETLNFPAGTTSFGLTHRFTRSGNHTITLLLTDDDHGVNVSTTRVKVNPSAAASRFGSLALGEGEAAAPLDPAAVNALFAQDPLGFARLTRDRRR